MTLSTKILSAAATLGILALAAPASAGPVGALTSAGDALRHGAANTSTQIEQVTYRCWRHHGHVRCGNVRPQVYSYYYAPRPYYYGYSARPSFSFSYGGHRRWY